MTQNFIFSNRLAGFWIGVELFLDPNRGNCNGTWKTTKYFEANENSSVFTTANHLYFYDEEEDIGAKNLVFFSSRSLKTREKCISFAQLVLLSLYIFEGSVFTFQFLNDKIHKY